MTYCSCSANRKDEHNDALSSDDSLKQHDVRRERRLPPRTKCAAKRNISNEIADHVIGGVNLREHSGRTNT